VQEGKARGRKGYRGREGRKRDGKGSGWEGKDEGRKQK